jgi:hypothetical protein
MAAETGKVQVLGKERDRSKELHLNPEKIMNYVRFLKDNSDETPDETPWHKAVENGNVELLSELWDLTKELQLNREELRKCFFFAKRQIWRNAFAQGSRKWQR